MKCYELSHLSDPVLDRDLAAAVHAHDHTSAAWMLAHLAEFDARGRYRPAAYPSMYAYCVGALGMSEDVAAKRIRVARVARQHPAIFPALAEGRLTSSSVLMLAPYLTPENAAELLAAAAHRSNAELERLLAERFPRPDLPVLCQAVELARIGPAEPPASAGRPASGAGAVLDGATTSGAACEPGVQPAARRVAGGDAGLRTRLAALSPGRFALQVTIAEETHDKLRYAQSLLGHAVPGGDLAQVLDRALEALIERLERRKFAASARSRPARHVEPRRHGKPRGRYIPAAVRRAVWQRDGGRCTFVSGQGQRCPATSRLEFDHVEALARGGESTISGLRLRCRAHNQYAAECAFGSEFMRHKREQARRRAAEARAATQVHEAARAHAEAEAAAARRACEEVVPWLRSLGFSAVQARGAAERCAAIAGASLEDRVRLALSSLAPGTHAEMDGAFERMSPPGEAAV
jgi:hypothetical protein